MIAAGCSSASGDTSTIGGSTAPPVTTVAPTSVPTTPAITAPAPVTTVPTGGSSAPTTSTTSTTTTTTTTTTSTTTITIVTTVTMPRVTTSIPAFVTISPPSSIPTFDLPPAAVSGLTVEIGGGSLEVIPEWNRNEESDVAEYRLWYSDDPGGQKTLLAEVAHDPNALQPPAYNADGNRIAYVDHGAQIMGKHCYQVSAVDLAGNEGQRSPERCLSVTPSVPTDFSVGPGGGSGEVSIRWTRIPDFDADHYNLWYSEWPGGTKTLLATVAHDPAQIAPPAWNAGGGTTEYIDFPRILEDNRNCYQLSAVDDAGHESARTPELCSTHL